MFVHSFSLPIEKAPAEGYGAGGMNGCSNGFVTGQALGISSDRLGLCGCVGGVDGKTAGDRATPAVMTTSAVNTRILVPVKYRRGRGSNVNRIVAKAEQDAAFGLGALKRRPYRFQT